MVPVILFLAAGLAKGGPDLPSGWAWLMLGLPLASALLQLWRPTRAGWHLAFGSFSLLILATAVIDLSLAVPRGLPPLSVSAAMVALFVVQFGVPAWLLWLAKPQGGRPTDRVLRAAVNGGPETGTLPGRPGGREAQ